MTAFALAVVEQAVEEAIGAPIKPSAAVRLALASLTLQGLTEPWQVTQLWENLRAERGEPGDEMAHYLRQRDLRIPLTAWTEAARRRRSG